MSTREVEAGRAYILIRLRNQVSGGLLAVERQFLNFGRTLATQSGLLATALKAPAIWMLKLAGDYERAQVRMEHFVGDTAKAHGILQELQEFDVIAPMDFGQLVQGTQLLLGFGDAADLVTKHIKQLGDISGGDSMRFERLSLALGQVITAGRLMAAENRQFAESGWNPLESLGKMLHKSRSEMMQMMSDGDISPEMVFAALDHATGPLGRFNNLLVDQAKTLPGLVSILWSYIKLTAMDIGFTMLDSAKELVGMAIDGMKWIRAWVKENKELVGSIMKVIVAVGAAAGVMFGIGMASMAVGTVLGVLRMSITMLVTPIAMLFSWMFKLPSAILGVVMAIGPLIAAVGSLFGFLFFTPTGWGLMTALLAGATIAVVYFQNIKDAISEVLQEYGALKQIVSMGLFGNKGIRDTGIVAALKAGHYQAAFNMAMLTMKAAGLHAAAFLESTFVRVLDSLGVVGKTIKILFSSIYRALINGEFATALEQLGNAFDLTIVYIKNQFIGLWESLKHEFNSMIDDMIERLIKLSPRMAGMLGIDAKSFAKDRKEREQQYKKEQFGRENQVGAGVRLMELIDRMLRNRVGGGSLLDMADAAYRELYKAVQEQHTAKKKEDDAKRKRGDDNFAGVEGMVGRLGSTGTFSTFGATLIGQGPGVMQQIARNTDAAAKSLARIEAKQRREDRQKLNELNRARMKMGNEPLKFNEWKAMNAIPEIGTII